MVFVTGGTGLLGSYLLRELVAREKKVIALYRKKI
ncbi:MAG TPA: SDR family oxidoreductase, partial [Agriterribacter sp.]|nr:SDR family oxidoreductase [Agriterribacter sp.]